MKLFAGNKEKENQNRLRGLITKSKKTDCPNGWIKETFVIGGLSEIGFSKENTELLLVVSSQGRGLIDCSKLKLIDRDNDTSYDWNNSQELWAKGIGKLKDEKIYVAGLDGGGLALGNVNGDHLQYMAPDWPIIDIIFEPKYKSIYKEGESKNCYWIFHDYELRAYGFSYCGQYFAIANSSELRIYKKIKTA